MRNKLHGLQTDGLSSKVLTDSKVAGFALILDLSLGQRPCLTHEWLRVAASRRPRFLCTDVGFGLSDEKIRRQIGIHS